MIEIWTGLFILLLFLILLLHVFSLPANWIALALIGAWKWARPETDLSWKFFLILVLIAGLAEAIEFGAQFFGARKFGSSGKGNIGGIVGAIAGAILGAPFFLGIGALIGALAGAYSGCLILEMGQGRSFSVSNQAAMGALLGKFFGLTVKFSLGVTIVALTAWRIWPS